MPALSHPNHSDSERRRNSAAKLTVLGSAAAKVFAMLCTLAQVPIALSYLGTEGYGLWIALMSVFGILNFVDFGLGVGMLQMMTEAYARDDAVALRRAFTSGVRSLLALGGLCALVALPLAWFCPWGAWWDVQDAALHGATGPAFALVVLAFVIGLPGNAVANLAIATQQNWRHSLWNAGGNALTLLVVWIAARQQWGFLPFVAVGALLPAFQNAGMWWQLRRRLGWQGASPGGISREERQKMLRTSATYAVPQIAMAVLAWLPAFAISLGSGVAAVTAFNLLQRIFSPLVHGHAVVLAPLWPMFAEARLRGDVAWLQRAQSRMLLATLAAVAGVLVLASVSRPGLTLWLGPAAPLPTTALTGAAALWFALQVLGRHFSYILLGAEKVAALALHSMIGFGAALGGLLAGSVYGDAAWSLGLGAAGFGLGTLPGLVLAARARPRSENPLDSTPA